MWQARERKRKSGIERKREKKRERRHRISKEGGQRVHLNMHLVHLSYDSPILKMIADLCLLLVPVHNPFSGH